MLLLSLLAAPAEACGPFMPMVLCAMAPEHALDAPPGGFAWELSQIEVPRRAFPPAGSIEKDERDIAITLADPGWADRVIAARADAGWSPAPSVAPVGAPRNAPAELVDYYQGADAWRRGDDAAARAAWTRLLARPEVERRRRTVWARYMLARLDERQQAYAAAQQGYREVAALVSAGFPDGVGLVEAAYGRETRVAWRAGAPVGEVLRRYLETGDTDSVRQVCAEVATSGDLGAAAADDLAARLVTAWMVAFPAAVDEARVEAWSRALGPRADVAGADRLGLILYQWGRYDAAKGMIDRAGDKPIARWVRSKLLLRAGDVAGADRELAAAAASLPDVEWGRSWIARENFEEPMNPRRAALAELGALRLRQGERVAAFNAFLDGGAWLDAAYVGERLLTIDELRAAIDARPAPPVAAGEPGSELPAWNPDPAVQLRAARQLLARRLVRNGSGEAAMPYFSPELQSLLRDYLDALRVGRSGVYTVEDRAKSMWVAGRILREHGIELVGTELAPDYAVWSGDFDWPDVEDARTRPRQGEAGEGGAERAPQPLPDEAARLAATAASPEKRFHYRYQAAALVAEGAALLPNDADAKVIALCRAGQWLQYRDPEASEVYYHAMVRAGWNHPLAQAADRARRLPAECGSPWPDEALPAAPPWCATAPGGGWMAAVASVAVAFGRRRRARG
jgi:hypothetical protein